jgi:hypothetical protein
MYDDVTLCMMMYTMPVGLGEEVIPAGDTGYVAP